MLFWQFPLHDAVSHHQLPMVELLIVERGAAVDALDGGMSLSYRLSSDIRQHGCSVAETRGKRKRPIALSQEMAEILVRTNKTAEPTSRHCRQAPDGPRNGSREKAVREG